jgi:hypothetical protein
MHAEPSHQEGYTHETNKSHKLSNKKEEENFIDWG